MRVCVRWWGKIKPVRGMRKPTRFCIITTSLYTPLRDNIAMTNRRAAVPTDQSPTKPEPQRPARDPDISATSYCPGWGGAGGKGWGVGGGVVGGTGGGAQGGKGCVGWPAHTKGWAGAGWGWGLGRLGSIVTQEERGKAK